MKTENIARTGTKALTGNTENWAAVGKRVVSLPQIHGWTESLLNLFAPTYPASRSYRHLACQIEADYRPRDGESSSVIFASPNSLDLTSDALLMFAYIMQDELNANVLLVDASLRSDGVGARLGYQDKLGFMDLMDEDGYQLDDLIQTTKHKRVLVLPAGKPMQHGIGKLSLVPEKVKAFFVEASKKYDYILLQQGAITTDSRYITLASQVNLIILIADEGETYIEQMDACRKKYHDHQIKNVRLVLSSSG